MTTQYTPILKLALPVTGELSGTWGDVVNDNITSMVEQAVAGLATINTWTANSHTLTTANGTTAESRCAMLVAQDASGLSASGEIICPALSKLYVLKNATSYQITLKTAAGTGIAVASGETAFLFCDGTNVNACVTTIINGHITGNLTVDGNTTLGNATSDTITATARFSSGILPSADSTYDLGSSGNSWKDLYIDGTATIAGITLSGGTANGIPYLNASKVLTSGSALTFDGTNFTVSNAGTQGFEVRPNSGDYAGGINLFSYNRNTSAWSPMGQFASYFAWQVNASEAMRLTSTGLDVKGKLGVGYSDFSGLPANGAAFAGSVGIGTSNPSAKLDVLYKVNTGATAIFTMGDNSGNSGSGYSIKAIMKGDNGGGARTGYGVYISAPYDGTNASGGYYALSQYGLYVDDLYAYYGKNADNTFGMYIKGGKNNYIEGNLGLGVTPSAWSGFKSFEIGSGALASYEASGVDVQLDCNAYYNGANWIYKNANSNTASRFRLNGNQFEWWSAVAGTYPNNIAFTQAMTLDASGNLGIGTTSPNNKLQLNDGSVANGTTTTFALFGGQTNAAPGAIISQISFNGRTDAGSAGAKIAQVRGADNQSDALAFHTGTASLAERLRIDSAGNLIIGDTQLTLITGIGAARTSSKGSADGMTVVGGAGNNTLNLGKSGTPSGSWVSFLSTGGTSYGNITVNGSGTAYNTTSDYRLKNVTGPITGSGAYIDNLKPVEGIWKVDGTPFVGLLAHEVQEVSRTPVATGVKDGVETQTMDYSSAELIANMIAELKSLRARVAQLESK